MPAKLIVSVSGLKDSTARTAGEFAAEMDGAGVPLSLLVAPRRGEGYRLADDTATQGWIRERVDVGDVLVLGGYDEAATKRRRAEFATIGAEEAELRLRAAVRTLRPLDLDSDLFAPPRWVASPGSWEALRRCGFRMCFDQFGIHDLRSGATERTRVLGIGDGFLSDPVWCRALVVAARRLAREGSTVRVSVAAKYLDRTSVRLALHDTVAAARDAGLTPGRYGDPVS